jgi:hypothetical protein
MREEIAKLRTWLGEHKREWTVAGPPRRFGYHGLQTPGARQLNEVQLPIKPVENKRSPQADERKS